MCPLKTRADGIVNVFNDNPVDQAKTWENLGAKRIHIVDLDGSIDGRPVNLSIIRDIVRNTNVPLELGGGVRDENTAQMYLDIGVSIVIWELSLRKTPFWRWNSSENSQAK